MILRRLAATDQLGRILTPLALGLGLWIGFPTGLAYQDMTSMISGMEGSGARWGAFVERAVAGSVHKGELAFADGSLPTGGISGSGRSMPGIGQVAFRGSGGKASDTPDEMRVNRSEKRGRIVRIAPVAPPRSFNAGSVLDRTSLILRPSIDEAVRMAFAKPEIKGREIEIAAAFHRPAKPATARLPPVVMALVNNDKADVLATAYAPAGPDYVAASPFASLLREEEDEDAGRFIPPVGKGDHAWMTTPLPARVFSKPEQKCLATAIYFEARGENVKGQAAVAQVVLNRVRAPAYPSTICGVVYQNQHLRNRCQFSFACDGIPDRITQPAHYRLAEDIAMAVTAGKIFISEVGSSTHYHATYVNPRWNRAMKRMQRIGLHIFYRTRGGGWS